MKNALIISLFAVTSILLLTCDSGTDVNPIPGSNPLPGTEAISDEQRLAVLSECSDFVNTLGDLKSEAEQQLVVNWLKTRPEFEDAGIAEGNVWAYFRDDRIVMIVPNWRGVGGEDGGRFDIPDRGSKKNKYQGGRTSGQPGSNEVKLFFGFGKGFKDYRTSLQNLFAKSNTKYTVALEEASIENLKNVKDVGVLFVDTHGGLGRRKPKKDEERYIFGLWTTDTISAPNEKMFEADLNSNFLTYMLAVHNFPGVSEWHYAITEYFVRYPGYMNFEENAVVYFDGCSGMTNHAITFRNALIKKAKNEKATYIGWTGTTDAGAGEPAALFIFDRMLGTNTDVVSIGAEDPVQRPFDFAKIFGDLAQFNIGKQQLGVSRYGGHLSYQSVNTSEIILTPSIEYINILDYESRMFIKGLFGDNPSSDGKVTVAGFSVPVTLWSPNLIICELPTVGTGSSGDVVVSVRGNKSNVVPISEWVIPIDFMKEEMSVKLETHLKLRIRADVHPYRSKPGEAPKINRPDTLGLENPHKLGWPIALGSTGTFVFGGQRQGHCTIEKCQVTQTESTVSRNGVLPYRADSGGLGFGAHCKWSVDLKTLYIHLYVNVPDVGYEYKTRMACEGQPTVETGQSINGTAMQIGTGIDLPVLQLHFDENYNIQAGEVVKSQDVPWGLCMKPEKFMTSAKWKGVSPAFPPKDDTQARLGGD